MKFDANLASYATVRDLEYLEALEKYGSIGQAAKQLNVHRKTIHKALDRLKTRAAIAGYSPEHDMVHPVPDGFKVRGVSTYYNNDGKAVGQWVKSGIDETRQKEIIKEIVDGMCEQVPRADVTMPPIGTADNLCTVYTLTDSHVGMLAWHKEGGDDWDLSIAERTLIGCFEQMVKSSPDASTCVVAQLGDFLHYDSALAAVTPQSGHSLDSDGRMPKMVKTAIRILRTVVARALEKHQTVVLLLAEGNHDISSSVWLRAMFQALYENEPRIQVIDSELPYYVYQHGQTMLAWHHGHLSKNNALPILFASQFPKVWGSTVKRYAHCGHRHHVEEKEHSGMTVIQHSTLAARDAYASRGGWMSERHVTSITYSDVFGQVARNTVTPEMLIDLS
jgi:DNA-binding transcriptional regulator YhcF (GntR family)